MDYTNFAGYFLNSMSIYGERNAIYWRKPGNHPSDNNKPIRIDEIYDSITGNKLKELVYLLSKSIEKFNFSPGDKVAIISESRFEWVVTDFACIMNRLVTVPIYTTMTLSQIKYILEHSESKLCFVSSLSLSSKIKSIINELPQLKKIISFNKIQSEEDCIIDFEDMIYKTLVTGKDSYNVEIADNYFKDCEKYISENDILTIIYTSGTTGNPKGVCLTHKNIISNVNSCQKAFDIDDTDRLLSFLPLAHSYERTTGYYFAMSVGAEIFYGQNLDTLASQFIEIKPTLVTAVPLLFTRIYNRLLKTIQTYPHIKQILIKYAFKYAIKNKSFYQSRKDSNQTILWRLYDILVYQKIRARTGGKIKYFISGGSALNHEVGKFMNAIGINVFEGYGLTEASPVIAVNRPGFNKIGTVGLPLDGVEVKIADDGEILVRGDNVMHGYYKDEAETKKSIIDGWLHTGDIGVFDNDGFLKITDRKKSLIKTEGGKYISLTHVEETLEGSDYIHQIIAFAGDEKPFVSALIVPDFDELHQFAEKNKISCTTNKDLVDKPEIIKLFESEILKYQSNHAKYERVRKFALLDHEFTIDSGEVTPTLKLKRKVIESKYKSIIDGLYRVK